MTAFHPNTEYVLRIEADLGENPGLYDLADFFVGVQDLIYIGGLLDRMDRFNYTVADRLAPQLSELTKLARSYYVARMQMASPLFVDILTYAGGTTGFIWSVLQLFDKYEDVRLKHSRREVESVINRQLKQQLEDVEKYYRGFDERFARQGHEIRDPSTAIDNGSKALSQMRQVSVEPKE